MRGANAVHPSVRALLLLLALAFTIPSGALAQGAPSPSADKPPAALSAPATQVAAPDPSALPISPDNAANATYEHYRLGTGDKLRVTVYGEDDLNSEVTVDGTGMVQLPLIGQIKAVGLSVHEFIDAITKSLADGYLKDPRVSVQVETYRPFYIMGEVNKPGEYPYENGLTVLGAVALAGGFTYRADDSDLYVRHIDSTKEEVVPANAATRVMPGDIVRVAERIF